MTLIIILIFGLFGLCFGSFSTVLIDRWKKGKSGIISGRSECPSCQHVLSSIELIPVISYIIQGGKCRNCHGKIPKFYPLAELLMMTLFMMMSWISLSLGYTPFDGVWYIFLIWGFIVGIYSLYDLRFMEIPDQIMIPGIYGTGVLLLLGAFFGKDSLLYDTWTYTSLEALIKDHFAGAIILYTFLFLQILIPGGYYLLKKNRGKDFIGLLLSYFLLPITMLIDLFKKPKKDTHTEEIPTWVGGGDLRIALFSGLTLGTIHGVVSFLFAYVIGSIIGIFILIIQSNFGKSKASSQIPFGPFLGLGWILSLCLYSDILLYLNI